MQERIFEYFLLKNCRVQLNRQWFLLVDRCQSLYGFWKIQHFISQSRKFVEVCVGVSEKKLSVAETRIWFRACIEAGLGLGWEYHC